MAEKRIHGLYRQLISHNISRREFVQRAAAIGIATPAISLFLKAASARAQEVAEATPAPVATPCEGDGCIGAGKEITVQCIDDSVKLPWYEVKAEYEAATGAKVTIIADPIAEAFPKLITDQSTGANQYDASMIGMWWLGELVAGDYLLPYDDFYSDTSGKYPKFDFEADLPAIQALHKYDGKKYVLPYDCDGQVLYYRRDLLADENHQKAFKGQFGYDLAVPATWEQLRDIAEYFTGKELGGDAGKGHGISMHLKVGGQGMFHYMSLSAPFVIGSENKNLYWFDPDNMEPLVESEGHKRAMSVYADLVKYGPEAMAGWALGEAWDYFLRGNAMFTYSWGDVAALAVERKSYVKGNVGTTQLPGTTAYIDPKSGKEYKTETPNIVGNTTGGSWAGVILKSSDVPELGYYWLALMATEPKERFYAARGTDGVDPGKTYQILPPDGTGNIEDYVAQGWDPQDAKEYTHAFYQTYQNPLQLPYLRIPGTTDYWNAMDIRLSESVTGQSTPEDALKNMAQDFRDINDQLGKDVQLEIYKKSLGIT